jgi:hypothetical protein
MAICADGYPRDIVYPAQAKVVAAHVPTSVNPLSMDSIPYLRATLEKADNKIRVIFLWYGLPSYFSYVLSTVIV